MLVMHLPILVCENKVTNVDCCFSNIGIYNTFPTLVCHIRIPMIPQSLTSSEIPNFHWNLKFFPVLSKTMLYMMLSSVLVFVFGRNDGTRPTPTLLVPSPS